MDDAKMLKIAKSWLRSVPDVPIDLPSVGRVPHTARLVTGSSCVHKVTRDTGQKRLIPMNIGITRRRCAGHTI
jgi:hypothetical protein